MVNWPIRHQAKGKTRCNWHKSLDSIWHFTSIKTEKFITTTALAIHYLVHFYGRNLHLSTRSNFFTILIQMHPSVAQWNFWTQLLSNWMLTQLSIHPWSEWHGSQKKQKCMRNRNLKIRWKKLKKYTCLADVFSSFNFFQILLRNGAPITKI